MRAGASCRAKAGTPSRLPALDGRSWLSAVAQEVWRREGPGGQVQVRANGNIRSSSGGRIHAALCSGLGIGLRSTWDIGPELKRGELEAVMPQYRGSSNVAIYAVYPCREFMPAKVNVLIEFLAELYGPEPYWNKGLDLPKVAKSRTAAKSRRGRSASKASQAVADAR